MKKHKIVYLTKEFTFDSSHNLYEYVGPCANKHGHTYKLRVKVYGNVDERTGLVLDFKELAQIVKENVIDVLDHKDLTYYFDSLNGMNTTAENLSVWIYDVIKSKLPATVYMSKVTLWETPTSFVEYCGEAVF